MYLCHQCQNTFKLSATRDDFQEKEIKCPKCGSINVADLPSWIPLGLNPDEGQPVWEYECQQCQKAFKLPVPSSPSQEEEISCPACGSRHIHRLTATGALPMYCG